jgi:hypothetical protein
MPLNHPLRRLPITAAALSLLAGCAYADRVVFEADINLRKGRVDVEYREETLWHQSQEDCASATECVEGMTEGVASVLKDIGEEGAEDATLGYRLRGSEVDRVLAFSADLDAEVLRSDMDWVQPLIVVNRRGKERQTLMVIAAPTDQDGDGSGRRITVEATGPHSVLHTTNKEGALTRAWLFTRGRSHVTLTIDFAETEEGQAAIRGWVAATPGLTEALRAGDLLMP